MQIDYRTNSPVIPGMGPPTIDDILAARERPLRRRTPKPLPEQRVWYRHTAYGALVPATVLEVVEDDVSDPSVWQYVIRDAARGPEVHPLTGERLRQLVPDPWWDVRLRTDDGLITMTREARITGSPGWLPMEGR